MAKLNCKRDEAFAKLLLSLIYRRRHFRGLYMLAFQDPRRSEQIFEVRRIVTDDTEGMSPEVVEKEIACIDREGRRILRECGLLT